MEVEAIYSVILGGHVYEEAFLAGVDSRTLDTHIYGWVTIIKIHRHPS